jgi:transcriptional regulator with XRE-family HTH domain
MPRRSIALPELQRIGRIVKEQREALGLTMDQLQERTGINKGHISSIEAGKVSLTLLMAARLTAGMEISMAVFDAVFKPKKK